MKKMIKEYLKKGICEDTRLVKNGDLFFVRERKDFDIFAALPRISRLVSAFVVEKKNKEQLPVLDKPVIFVNDLQKAYHEAIDHLYGFDPADFTAVAVTGTNGKTTTTFIVHHLLNCMGKKAALFGTVKYMIGKKSYPSTHTTPDYMALRRMFRECKKNNSRYLVMEASSHGIEQGRLDGIDFRACAFTNLTRDHLDYHKTFENYFAAKQKLFIDHPRAVAVINGDDQYGAALMKQCRKVISFGEKDTPVLLADNITLNTHETSFDLVYKNECVRVTTSLLGHHNVHNILTAVGILLGLGFKLGPILDALVSFKAVPGRLERVAEDIYVDYAHTPDALTQALKTLRECGYRNIISVFGCGGDRDKGKRPMMGKVASELSDYSIVTSDNPRSEDPRSIIEDIEKGFCVKNFLSIVDRETALKEALIIKGKYSGSCLLVAGKGHEDYQVIGDKKIPYSDQKVIRKVLRHAYR